MAWQSLCNGKTIASQWLRNGFTIALQSPCNSFAMQSNAKQRSAIASRWLCNGCAIAKQRKATQSNAMQLLSNAKQR
jgi:hypothetical protein